MTEQSSTVSQSVVMPLGWGRPAPAGDLKRCRPTGGAFLATGSTKGSPQCSSKLQSWCRQVHLGWPSEHSEGWTLLATGCRAVVWFRGEGVPSSA
jgi:hypothetical protein